MARRKPIAWVGRSTVSTLFADLFRVLPIRIKANALGDNIPSRDLLLSPDHALFLDGVLVQAGALVNGTSIVREHDVPERFTYFHVELDDHSLILAENTPAETFIDNIDRVALTTGRSTRRFILTASRLSKCHIREQRRTGRSRARSEKGYPNAPSPFTEKSPYWLRENAIFVQ